MQEKRIKEVIKELVTPIGKLNASGSESKGMHSYSLTGVEISYVIIFPIQILANFFKMLGTDENLQQRQQSRGQLNPELTILHILSFF